MQRFLFTCFYFNVSQFTEKERLLLLGPYPLLLCNTALWGPTHFGIRPQSA
jgi:hypothetical protein